MLKTLFALSAVLTLGLSLFFIRIGLLTYSMSDQLGLDRPQIADTLFQSTEMSNIAVVTILLAVSLAMTSTTLRSLLVISACALPSAYVFAVSGSIGSYVCLALVFSVCVWRRMRRSWSPARVSFMVALAAVGAATLMLTNEEAWRSIRGLTGVLTEKVTNDQRTILYSWLQEVIRGNVVHGIGSGEFFERFGWYPHHNILGIWGELGLLAVSAYFLYLGACVYWSWRLVTQSRPRRQPSAHAETAFCLSMLLLFLHLKGLVQDTWIGLQMFLLTGGMIGICSGSRLVLSRRSSRDHDTGRPLVARLARPLAQSPAGAEEGASPFFGGTGEMATGSAEDPAGPPAPSR